MVSLDGRNQFIDDLRNAPSTQFAFALVFGESRKIAEATTVADRAVRAIATNNQVAFAEVIEELRRRKVKADSDWVLDDFLLFALLVGSKKFRVGGEVCSAIINERRPTNELDTAFNGALRSLSQDAYAIEGAFSFVKLVFCDLIGQLRIDSAVARSVYAELTKPEFFAELDTFPRLLAYRAFDLLVRDGIEEKLDSMDAIVSAIESRSNDMSIRDWCRIAIAMRPSVLAWIVGGLIALCTASFSAGRWFASPTESNSKETLPNSSVPESNPVQVTNQGLQPGSDAMTSSTELRIPRSETASLDSE